MNDEVRGSAAPSSARRRLLKGSFATPAVMTLCSGSALAASSALNRIGNLPTGADPVSAQDHIFRIAEYKTKVGSEEFTVFKGTDVVAAVTELSGAAYMGNVSAGDFKDSSWYRVATGAETQVGNPNSANAPALTKRLLALRFTNNGNALAPMFTIVGVADSGSESGLGQIMTMSAWGSVF